METFRQNRPISYDLRGTLTLGKGCTVYCVLYRGFYVSVSVRIGHWAKRSIKYSTALLGVIWLFLLSKSRNMDTVFQVIKK